MWMISFLREYTTKCTDFSYFNSAKAITIGRFLDEMFWSHSHFYSAWTAYVWFFLGTVLSSAEYHRALCKIHMWMSETTEIIIKSPNKPPKFSELKVRKHTNSSWYDKQIGILFNSCIRTWFVLQLCLGTVYVCHGKDIFLYLTTPVHLNSLPISLIKVIFSFF